MEKLKTIKIDHFKNYRFISSLKTGENGVLSFVVKQADMQENKYNSDIWLLPPSGEAYALTETGEAAAHYWLGSEIIFAAARNKKDKEATKGDLPHTVLYSLDTSKAGEAKRFLSLDYDVSNIVFIDREHFFFTAAYLPFNEKAIKEHGKEKAAELIKEEADYEVIDELPFWNNGGGFSRGGRNRLYYYASGKVKALSDEKTDVGALRLSPDKSVLFYTANRYKNVMPIDEQLFMVDTAAPKVKKLKLPHPVSLGNFECVDSQNLVLAASEMKTGGLNENFMFFTYNTVEQTLKQLNDDIDLSIGNGLGTDLRMAAGERWHINGDLLYFIATAGYSCQLMSVNIKTGAVNQITTKKGDVSEHTMLDDGSLYFAGMRKLNGVEIYKVGKNGKEKQITSINSHLSSEYEQYPLEEINYENADGIKLTGWIIKPRGFKEGKKYPAIFDIHGGPKTVYGTVNYHEMQFWASRGFAVFFTNPRGSDGFGEKFSDIRGKYGTIDYDDLMLFCDIVLEQHKWIDKKRLGVTGGSYGGYMTNWIIGHTNRFAAAASQRSISNWISMALTTDIGYYFAPDQTAADVWQSHDELWEQSPLKYANKVKTPTLFIHSDEDYRCWMAEGLQMYTALQLHGVETRLCLFHGETHELSRSGKPKHRVRRLKEITDWFEGRL